MARTIKDKVNFVKLVHSEHNEYWKTQLPELKKYRDAYENKFWASNDTSSIDQTMIRIETSDTFVYIEGFIASLFSKTPAVIIGEDKANSIGNPKLAQTIANRFLYDQREQIENASRLALIYQFSALKLVPTESNEMLDQVTIQSLPCWEVIVDRDAVGTKYQRYIGHSYYLNMAEAKRIYGNKDFVPVAKTNYFNGNMKQTALTSELPPDYLYIEVVELYDFLYDNYLIWSPNYKKGTELLLDEEVPVRTYNNKPLSNIIPLYYNRSPTSPMIGISSISRIYDQAYEKNIFRTYQANAVRRDARQYLYKNGVIDEESIAKIATGIDGAMIPVDTTENLNTVIAQVPNSPTSSNWERYMNYVEQDLNRASILAPFSRGEATKATATEITALAQYSASEIGKLARERDQALESIVTTYLRTLYTLSEDDSQTVIESEGDAYVLKADDLDGKFRINALDQGSTPLSDAMRKTNFITIIPTLERLGVSKGKILEEVVRSLELPKSFLEVEAPTGAESTTASVPGPSAADVRNMDTGVTEQLTDAEVLAQSLRPQQ